MPKTSDSFVADFRLHLGTLGFDTVLIGALPAARYRDTPRETTDIDLLARSLDGLAQAMGKDGYTVTTMAEPGGEPYIVFIKGEQVTVDVLLAETDYQREAMKRGGRGDHGRRRHVIIHKLLAWRKTSVLAIAHDDIASILVDDGNWGSAEKLGVGQKRFLL